MRRWGTHECRQRARGWIGCDRYSSPTCTSVRKDSRAAELLQFLASVEVDYLFLVGDIVDFRSLRKSFYWPQEHNEVLRAILGKAREGTRVIYIPGNHDDDMREFCGSVFGNLEIRRKYVHSTADGRELLVMHGDEFDAAVKCSRWLARLGGGAYELALRLNRAVNALRRLLGLPYWSFANYLKLRLKNAVRYVEAFEHAAAHAAVQRKLHGIVCGHIHRAGHAQHRRRALLQRRRLGGKLHRAGRGHERPPGGLVLGACGAKHRAQRSWSTWRPDSSRRFGGTVLRGL